MPRISFHASPTKNSPSLANSFVAHGLTILFLGAAGVLAGVYAGIDTNTTLVVFAAIFGGYMALNIGAFGISLGLFPYGPERVRMVGD